MNPQTTLKMKIFVDDFHLKVGTKFKPNRIFSSGCVSCHGQRAEGKSGETLYTAVCAPCHRTGGSTSALDKDYLSSHPPASLEPFITKGVKNMPGFGKAHGGPLTSQQIDSLIAYLVQVSKATGSVNK